MGDSMFMRSKSDPDKRKVGGGLALLIFGMMVGGPLYTLGSMVSGLDDAVRKYPQLAQVPAWGHYTFACWATALVSIGFAISAGYRLWKIHTPESVRFAILALWLFGPGSVVAIIIAATVLFKTAPSLDGIGADAAKSLIITSLWTGYLLWSKRVRNVYRSGALQFPEGS